MPVVFRYRNYRFFFFSNEGDPREPLHIHVRAGEKLAKFWLEPEVRVAEAYGFAPAELNRLAKLVVTHRELIARKWHEHFSD